MPHRAARCIVPALLLACAAGAVQAQGQPTKGEQMLKYRKAVYQAIAWNFGPMGAMAQGKAPFDAAEFAMRAGDYQKAIPGLGLLADDDLRRRMSESGLARAQEFSWERVTAKVDDYYGFVIRRLAAANTLPAHFRAVIPPSPRTSGSALPTSADGPTPEA